MFDTIPAPRATIGAGSTMKPVENTLQQNNQQQTTSVFDTIQVQQPSQQPISQQAPAGRIVSDTDAKEADSENVQHLKNNGSDKVASRESATSCHAVDLHGQPLFRYDGSPYIIKGAQSKINMIHRNDLDGTLLFKSNGDPLLGPLTYKQDGTPNGIRNVGRIGGNRNAQQQNQQQQQSNLFNQQTSNDGSLASRLNNQQSGNVLFGNTQQQAVFNQGNQLTNQQIAQLQRAGIPDANIKAFMQTGNKQYLDRNVNVGVNQQSISTGGLSQQDRKTCMDSLVLLFKQNKLGNDKALAIKNMIEQNTLSTQDAQKLVQMARQCAQQQQSVFGNDSVFDNNMSTSSEPEINLF